MPKQYVWMVRYGLTHPPLVEGVGPYDMDIEPTEGLKHSDCLAERIAASPPESLPTKVFTSPFLRTTHTAHILTKGLSGDGAVPPVCIEEGLTEWLTPSLVVEESTGTRTFPRSTVELGKLFDSVDVDYKSVNPEAQVGGTNGSSPTTTSGDEVGRKPQFPETEEALLARCRNTLELLLRNNPGCNMLIVSHAPCIQSIAFALEEGAKTTSESKLGPWPLGGITRFSRDVGGDGAGGTAWSMDMYGDTSHMPGPYRDGMKEWSLPCFAKKE